MQKLADLNIENESFKTGLEELTEVVKYVRLFGIPDSNFKVDLTIARGLDYYTGTVYETFLNEYRELGSVCSGGRYENLAEHYTDKKLPGVGISSLSAYFILAFNFLSFKNISVLIPFFLKSLANFI